MKRVMRDILQDFVVAMPEVIGIVEKINPELSARLAQLHVESKLAIAPPPDPSLSPPGQRIG